MRPPREREKAPPRGKMKGKKTAGRDALLHKKKRRSGDDVRIARKKIRKNRPMPSSEGEGGKSAPPGKKTIKKRTILRRRPISQRERGKGGSLEALEQEFGKKKCEPNPGRNGGVAPCHRKRRGRDAFSVCVTEKGKRPWFLK